MSLDEDRRSGIKTKDPENHRILLHPAEHTGQPFIVTDIRDEKIPIKNAGS
jgi:hypothetical protein